MRRDRTRNRVRRFGQALVLAHELAPDITHLHAHFLHTPASVARYAALLRGLKWSCSAHAKDIWTSERWEKSEKLADCAWAVTCTRANLDHLSALAPEGRVHLSYHGLDLARFPPPLGPRPARDGAEAEDPVVVLSIGRAVEKKGHVCKFERATEMLIHSDLTGDDGPCLFRVSAGRSRKKSSGS